MKKICTNCKQEKEIISFHKDKYRKDGYKPMCKPCNKIIYFPKEKTYNNIEFFDGEIWKEISGYEGKYLVSNFSRIYNKSYIKIIRGYVVKTKDKLLNLTISGSGYAYVKLYKDGTKKSFKVHRLVAEAFIPNPKNLPIVNHIDGNKTNNDIKNLEWCNNRENASHAYKSKNVTSKYTGVSYDRRGGKWYSCIRFNGKTKSLGLYDTEIEASNAYQLQLKETNIENKYI